MALGTRLELSEIWLFWFPARWSRAGLKPCLEHSRIPNVHQTNARVRNALAGEIFEVVVSKHLLQLEMFQAMII